MNKNGLTLVELLAVIAIIGLLTIMITPGIMALRDNVLTSTLKSKVSQIENAAKDYGQDNLYLFDGPVCYAFDGSYNPATGMYEDKAATDSACNRKPDCVYRKVIALVNYGYLSEKNTYIPEEGDEEELESQSSIINPKTGESMDDILVCIRYDTNDPMTRQLVSYLVDFDYREIE